MKDIPATGEAAELAILRHRMLNMPANHLNTESGSWRGPYDATVSAGGWWKKEIMTSAGKKAEI